jgi:formiminotetrahydrofolate cyclodeaminase
MDELSGGAVAATVASLAASLAAAAADRSRAEWPEAPGARAQALALHRRASRLAPLIAAAHAAAAGALADRGGEDRDQRIGAAVRAAAEPPLELAATASDIAELAGTIAAHGAVEIRADAAVAGLLAAAAARSAAHLVEINLVVGGEESFSARARGFAEAAARAAAAAELAT